MSTCIYQQNDLIIEMPRQRKQTSRYGKQDSILEMSDIDSSESEFEDDGAIPTVGRGKGIFFAF